MIDTTTMRATDAQSTLTRLLDAVSSQGTLTLHLDKSLTAQQAQFIRLAVDVCAKASNSIVEGKR